MTNNHAVLRAGMPLEERVGQLHEEWVRGGRNSDQLLSGKAFFTVYSWYLGHRANGDIASYEYVTASYDFLGGSKGWDAMLRERAVCESCHDTFRLENIGVCTGCLRYSCYACQAHASCAGEIV
ncbi:hypothetical protein [Streptomyces sp. NPDC006645]|uniref:hypothetical protein n=1 Tax=unclassified Streptomyces TaxID=2593676 RepID=UPI0033AB5FF0